MLKYGWAVVALVLSAGACGRKDMEGDGSRDAGSFPSKTAAPRAPVLYGPDGELLSAGRHVAGLELPRGLEQGPTYGNRHVFHASVPIAKLQRFFGARLLTGKVERVGDGAVYRQARLSNGKSTESLDVSLLPMASGKVRVEIAVISAAPTKVLTDSEARELLKRQAERLE